MLPGRCEECGENLLYFFAYDASCCPHCDAWKEKKCGDTKCEFCSTRPHSPSVGLYYWQLEYNPVGLSKSYFRLKPAASVKQAKDAGR